MKFFFDFFPVLLFFLTYKFFGELPPEIITTANQIPYLSIDPNNPKDAMFLATLVIIIATVLQNIIHFYVYRRLEKMHIISLALLLVLGGATIIMKDAKLLVWKVTVINWLFAAVFLASQFIGKKSVIQRLMGQAFEATQAIWTKLNLSWVLFFFIIGAVNLYVYYQFGEQNWVNFKFYGLMGSTFVFVIAQTFYLMKNATIIESIEGSDKEE